MLLLSLGFRGELDAVGAVKGVVVIFRRVVMVVSRVCSVMILLCRVIMLPLIRVALVPDVEKCDVSVVASVFIVVVLANTTRMVTAWFCLAIGAKLLQLIAAIAMKVYYMVLLKEATEVFGVLTLKANASKVLRNIIAVMSHSVQRLIRPARAP